MVLKIKRTKGLTCKACDRSLDITDCDGELCGACLTSVHELNKWLYEDNDLEAENKRLKEELASHKNNLSSLAGQALRSRKRGD